MVDVLPLFRFQMGSQNSYFPEARADRVVVKHLPIDFRTRYEAGEVGALRAEFRRIFQARFPHVAELLTEGWATRYINDALRFCDTERMRVITAYKSDLFWAETGSPPRTWKTVTEGEGEAQVTFELAARDLSPTWRNALPDGRRLVDALHPRARNSLGWNRAEIGQASQEYAAYLDAAIRGDSLQPWHSKPDWIEADAQEYRRPARPRTGTTLQDRILDYLDERKLEVSAIRNGDTAGLVYAITTEQHPEWIKIGYTIGESAEARRDTLQQGNPFNLKILHTEPSDVARFAERLAHEALQNERRGESEWFKITPQKAREAMWQGASATQTALKTLPETQSGEGQAGNKQSISA